LPFLRKSDKGSIIIVSSGAASKGYKGWGAYGASKAAVNHIASTLAVEEENITTIALRPGVVDTEMQALIRSDGQKSMREDHSKFIDLHKHGQLVKPQDPGHVLAALANNPPKELSGKMYSWNDEEMKPFCLEK
jgi:NAD(P)-dependent dehydrogenase (short-subunit alcohol dehydrogenase family)